MRLRMRIAIGCLCLAGVPPVLAQSPESPAACANLIVTASVVDAQGLPLGGLGPEGFKAEYRGRPLRVVSAGKLSEPIRMAIMLDASPTMREEKSGKWKLAQDVAGHAVEYGPARKNTSFAVVGSGVKPGVIVPTERIGIAYDLQSLISSTFMPGIRETRGPIYDIILKGLEGLEGPRPGDVLLLITDGADEGSKSKPAEVQRRLLEAGVRLFVVSLPTRYERSGLLINQPTTEQQVEHTDLLQTVLTSGGKYLRVAPKFRGGEWGFRFHEEELQSVATSLQVLYLQMAGAYRLEIEAPAGLTKRSLWKLEPVPPPGIQKKSLTLYYPKELMPCSVAASAAN